MPKVSDEHRASRRDQIIDAALSCFAAEGFHRTSMADIIAASGLSAGAIYLQFAGKKDIAVAVAERVLGRSLRAFGELDAAGEPPAPAQLLRTVLAGLTREIVDTRLVVQLWGEAVTDDEMRGLVEAIFARLRSAFTGYLRRWAVLHRGIREEEAEGWAERVLPALLAFGQGYLLQSALLPGFDEDAYFAAVGELLPG